MCAPIRYVKASSSVGPEPSRALASAARVTASIAKTSFPSTRTPGNPKPSARRCSGMRLWRSVGSEIAQWLFCSRNTIGAWKTEDQTNASAMSPWLMAPSPMQAITALSAPSCWTPIA